jgi:hypothetical protein
VEIKATVTLSPDREERGLPVNSKTFGRTSDSTPLAIASGDRYSAERQNIQGSWDRGRSSSELTDEFVKPTGFRDLRISLRASNYNSSHANYISHDG